jgi:hypothetical protein
LGETSDKGSRESIIVFSQGGQLITIFINGLSKLISRCEVLLPHSIIGDHKNEYKYSDYRKVSGLMHPTSLEQLESGKSVKKFG